MGLAGPSSAASCTASTAAVVTFRWVPELSGIHPGPDTLDRHLHLYWLCQPYSSVWSCNLPSWWPSSDWLHPAWLWLVHMWLGCCWCVHRRSTHTSTHGISQPLPTWGQETPTCVLGSVIQPCSSFYWHRLLLLWCHPPKSDRGQPPNQCHKHQYGAWMA